jgi:hypothetical protein
MRSTRTPCEYDQPKGNDKHPVPKEGDTHLGSCHYFATYIPPCPQQLTLQRTIHELGSNNDPYQRTSSGPEIRKACRSVCPLIRVESIEFTWPE